MNTKSKVLMVLFLLITSSVYGQTDIESLRGLKGVYVIIESLKPDIEADGLREDQIQTDVELKLRLAGIKVLTEEEWEKELGCPCLYVKVSARKWESIYSCSTDVELHQDVYLVRDSSIRVFGAITWYKSSFGLIGEMKVYQIRDSIKDYVDEFINDYLSVNPK